MTSLGEAEGLIFLDACCLINLFASGRAEEILVSLPHRFAVARYVVETEVLEIDAGEQNEPPSSDEPGERRVSIHPRLAALIDGGTLEQLDPASESELHQLVRFASQLDDGEAHTCALALVHGGRVATDDRKAIRVVTEAWRDLGESTDPVLRTSELLFAWADEREVTESEVRRMVKAVTRRASFFPPREDPHRRRWMRLLREQT